MAECPNCGSEYTESAQECGNCGQAFDPVAESDGEMPVGGEPSKVDVAGVITNALMRYWPMWVAGIVFVVVQWNFPLLDWWKSWMKDDSYYSHGPLVPAIAAFVVWANRKRMAAVKIRPSWLGAPVILLSIPVFVFGRWTGSGVLCGATFITFLIGAVLLFTGVRMTRLLIFPMLFLISMIPAPATVLDNATLRVQLQSTTVAAKMLTLTGYEVRQEGATISSDGLPEPLLVGAPCSGFRLLISLLTFTAFFVYMLQAPAWKKAVLVILASPLSLFINALRITMIGYAGFWVGTADAMHKFHDWSGYIGLLICFVILFGFAKLIKANTFGIPDPKVGPDLAASDMVPAYNAIGRGGRGFAAIGLLCLIGVSNVVVQPLEATAKGQINRANMPVAFGDWTSREIQIDDVTLKELKTADLLQRVYTNDDDGRQVVVFIEAARDTDAFHDPHSCLPGGGHAITQDQTVEFEFDNPRPTKVRATMLQAAGQYGPHMVVYWYMNGLESCSSTSEVRRKMRAFQLRDLVALASHPGDREELRAQINERQWYWYRFSTDIWSDTETDLEVLKEFIQEFVANRRNFGE